VITPLRSGPCRTQGQRSVTFQAGLNSTLTALIQKGSRQSLSVRSWNILAWAALSNPSDKWVSILLAQLPAFSLVHSFSLRAYTQSAANPTPASAITDINRAYLSIKLWMMLARKNALHGNNFTLKKEDAGISAEDLVWNELWPAFESLATVFEVEGYTENNSVSGMPSFLYQPLTGNNSVRLSSP
jgi:hypothetical protein